MIIAAAHLASRDMTIQNDERRLGGIVDLICASVRSGADIHLRRKAFQQFACSSSILKIFKPILIWDLHPGPLPYASPKTTVQLGVTLLAETQGTIPLLFIASQASMIGKVVVHFEPVRWRQKATDGVCDSSGQEPRMKNEGFPCGRLIASTNTMVLYLPAALPFEQIRHRSGLPRMKSRDGPCHSRRADTSVSRGRFQFCVAEQLLDDPDIGAMVQQVSRKTVPKHVRVYALL